MIKEKSFVSAVMYIHDDQGTALSFFEQLFQTLDTHFENFEIVLVDDCSDGVGLSKIKEFCREKKAQRTTVVSMSFYHGVEFAMRAGTDLAIGDYVFEFDTTAYGFDADLMMKMYRLLLDGNDVVSAVPTKNEVRSSKVFYKVFNRAARLPNDIGTEVCRVLSRRAINRVLSSSRSIPYRKVAYANSGLPVCSIAFEPKRSRKEVSKEERRYRSDLAIDALILFTHTGYRVAAGLSVLMMVFAVLVALYAIAAYCFSGTVAGWATTILFLSFGFFCLFGVLAFVIKYLQVIVDLVFKKKDYNFEKIERL